MYADCTLYETNQKCLQSRGADSIAVKWRLEEGCSKDGNNNDLTCEGSEVMEEKHKACLCNTSELLREM